MWLERTELSGTLEAEQVFMATMQELGNSLDNKHLIFVLCGSLTQDEQQIILELLEEQPSSYEEHWTSEEMLQLVQSGMLTAWVYYRDGELMGMALTSHVRYSPRVQGLSLVFVSCRNIWAMSSVLPVIEERARDVGYSFVEGMVHHSIAEYLHKKRGYEVKGVHVKKPIYQGRIH